MRARSTCSLCQGTGWNLDFHSGISRARRCSCGDLSTLVMLKEKIRIPTRYQDCDLSSYIPRNARQARALECAQRFASRFPQVSRGLFFSGGSRTGKTHLAVGIARELLHRYQDDILFVDFATEFSPADGGRTPSGFEDLWHEMCRASLLLLDNFGIADPIPHVVRRTEDLIRLRSRTRRATILTGQQVRFGQTFRAQSGDEQSQTRVLLAAMNPAVRVQLFGEFKLLSLEAETSHIPRRPSCSLFA